MKKMKKLLSMLLTVIMVLAMAAPSFAAEEIPTTGTITITNAREGHTYNAYKIFDLTMVSNGKGYAYTLTTEWAEFFKTGAGASFVKLDGNNLVPVKFDDKNEPVLIENTEGLAAAIRKKLTEESTIVATGMYAGTDPDDPNEEGSLTLADKNDPTNTSIPLGYYLVDSTVGTLCALNTNARDVEFRDKSEAPTITKTIPEESNDVAVGNTIPYTVTINAKAGAQDYKVVDILSKGLTFNEDIKVTKNETKIEAGENTYTSASSFDSTTEETTVTIEFKTDFCNGLTDTDVIVITYSADVNGNAVTVDAVKNNVTLDYGRGGTVSSSVESKTYQFDLQKTVMDANGESTDTQLEGATFKLYTAETGGDAIKFVAMEDDNGKKVYRVAKSGEVNTVEEIVAGYAIIKGLDVDVKYYLEETKAPDGYNAVTGRVQVENITRTANDVNVPSTPEAQIANSTGALLPSTGGIGTTIFYAAGIILMAGAVFFVVRRKRA